MKIENISWKDLTPEQSTNYFLFGQKNKPTPEELISNEWISRTSNLTVNITDIDSYMNEGPGRFANAEQINLIRSFFEFKHLLNQSYIGEYSVEEAKSLFGSLNLGT